MGKKLKMTLNFVTNKESKNTRVSVAPQRHRNDNDVMYPEQEVETVTYYPRIVKKSLILLLAFLFLSCTLDEPVQKIPVVLKKQQITVKGGEYNLTLYEFDYKDHVYISCDVHGGIALTHAGHCWCNPNQMKITITP